MELKKTYVLNPLAPEFVPNRLRHATLTGAAATSTLCTDDARRGKPPRSAAEHDNTYHPLVHMHHPASQMPQVQFPAQVSNILILQ